MHVACVFMLMGLFVVSEVFVLIIKKYLMSSSNENHTVDFNKNAHVVGFM